MNELTSNDLPFRHLLGIEGLSPDDITEILDLSDQYVAQNRQVDKKRSILGGRTQINLFFETSTRTRTSFELAGKRLGADVINMSATASAIKKGETLIDTAATLNAMHPDALVVRHPHSGAVALLSQKMDCSVINAGDGSHEHPTQALLDALTIRRRLGHLHGLTVAICGDILHSRVARSNIMLLSIMGAHVRAIAPPTLLPGAVERMGVEIFHNMAEGLKDVDIVMMLRLQNERMNGAYVEIDSDPADDINRSVIREQVEMGVAVRMAVLDLLSRRSTNQPPVGPEEAAPNGRPEGPGEAAS